MGPTRDEADLIRAAATGDRRAFDDLVTLKRERVVRTAYQVTGNLEDALDVAQATGFVQTMPGGLDSEINQGGTNVSGGQRQRLSIARALVAKPEIYVFDDSFSALDVETAARLRDALERSTRDAAVLVVAQRVSTISGADQILVLDDGVLVGRGTHAELVRDCPTYAEIVDSQLGEGAAA